MKVEKVVPVVAEYHFVCSYEEAIAIRMALIDATGRYKEAAHREEWAIMAEQISELTR